MDSLQVMSTNQFFKLGFHLLIAFLRPDVIACSYNSFEQQQNCGMS